MKKRSFGGIWNLGRKRNKKLLKTLGKKNNPFIRPPAPL